MGNIRGYELPASDLLGGIVFENRPRSRTYFNLIIEFRGGPPQRIYKLHQSYISLQFPLLFVFGQPGFYPELQLKPRDGRGRGKRVTMNAYYKYQLHPRVYDSISRGDREGITAGSKIMLPSTSIRGPCAIYNRVSKKRVTELFKGYKLVTELMMHGPYGAANLGALCMQEGSCNKHFPKKYNNTTFFDTNGHTQYQRRDTWVHVMKGESKLDCCNVISYSRALCLAFEAHINVECCGWSLLETLQTLRPETAPRSEAFAKWLLDVGNGETEEPDKENDQDSSWITIPPEYSVIPDETGLSQLIDFIYDDATLKTPTARALQQKVIVCPKNQTADAVNAKILSNVEGQSRIYLSKDEAIPIDRETGKTELLYPMEYLNTNTFLEFPPHELELKVGHATPKCKPIRRFMKWYKNDRKISDVEVNRSTNHHRNKNRRKVRSRKMSATTIASLKIGQENCILEAKVYLKWISKSVPDMKELALCCMLIDREGIRFTCEAMITSIRENRDWKYASCSQCSKGSTQQNGTYTCEDHEKQDPVTYRYNFKATATDGTATAQFTFFLNAGDKITSHTCTQLAQKYKESGHRQLPIEIVNIIGKKHIFHIRFAPSTRKGAGEFVVDDVLDIQTAVATHTTGIGTILAASSATTTKESISKDECPQGTVLATSPTGKTDEPTNKDTEIPDLSYTRDIIPTFQTYLT
ncbi:DNA helicase [Tanacetum coccineum]